MTRRLGLLAAVLIVVAGCGSHHGAPKRTAPAAAARARACGDADERTHAIGFRTSDGVALAGAVAAFIRRHAAGPPPAPLDTCQAAGAGSKPLSTCSRTGTGAACARRSWPSCVRSKCREHPIAVL